MVLLPISRSDCWPLRPVRTQVTTHGEWVWVKKTSGDSVRAYVAYPERKDTAGSGAGAGITAAFGRINSMLPSVGQIMNQLGKKFAADSYPGTGHGFLKPGRKGSDTDQVEKAWVKIQGFLAANLAK